MKKASILDPRTALQKKLAKSAKGPFRIGIMGGTFNPIHYGHLLCAEQARCKFRLRQVIFVPSGEPPHKHIVHIAPAQHRYNMTLLATSTNPHFSVSRVEIDREGPSYAVDTIAYFIKLYSEYNPKVYFITGCDAVTEILSWRKPEKILSMATIIAATRPGYDFKNLRDTVGLDVFKQIKPLEASALAISSTDIRSRIEDGRPIRYLLPEAVEQYVRKHGLYEAP